MVSRTADSLVICLKTSSVVRVKPEGLSWQEVSLAETCAECQGRHCLLRVSCYLIRGSSVGQNLSHDIAGPTCDGGHIFDII